MPAAVTLDVDHADSIARYLADMRHARRKTGRSTVQSARSFAAKLQCAGGWHELSLAQQVDAIKKARSFSSWLMVTGGLIVPASVFGRVDLWLGISARTFCPDAYAWFQDASERLGVGTKDIKLQWNTLAKVTAVTGILPDQVSEDEFEQARRALVDAYTDRGLRASGRNLAAAFHRLRVTLFNAGRLEAYRNPSRRPHISSTGWTDITPAFADTARRYVGQITLSLRPSTVKAIERDLRQFGAWLTRHHPSVVSCADLLRWHIEEYKTWLAHHPRPRTGKPLNRVSFKNSLINLHCFFDRITEWDYPNRPQKPLVFAGDLPIIDKPLPRFLDDAAAAKLLRTARQDTDPLARLVTEPARSYRHPPRRVA